MTTAVAVDIEKAVKEVSEVAEKIKNDALQEFPVAATPGDAVRQGDLYIQLIEPLTELPAFYKKVTPTWPFQLAPGDTKGSRHCIEESEGIEIYVSDVFDMFNGNEDNWEIRRSISDKVRAYACLKAGCEIDGFWQNPKAPEISRSVSETLQFCGPIFAVKNLTRISHPEHGDWMLPPGTYRCVFQRTIDSADKVRRVLD